MSCLIAIEWDQSTCKERVESKTKWKILAYSWTRAHNLEICSLKLYRLSYPDFDESCPIKMTFIHTCTSDTNVYIVLCSRMMKKNVMSCTYTVFVLDIRIYLYWTNSKETHMSCCVVAFNMHNITNEIKRDIHLANTLFYLANVLCWLAATVAMFYGNLQNSVIRSRSVKSSSVISLQIGVISDQLRVSLYMVMSQNVM